MGGWWGVICVLSLAALGIWAGALLLAAAWTLVRSGTIRAGLIATDGLLVAAAWLIVLDLARMLVWNVPGGPSALLALALIGVSQISRTALEELAQLSQ